MERPPIAVGKGRIRPERNCLRKQVCKQCFCMLSKLNAAANLSFILWEVTLQDMEINIPQSDFMVGFESVHDNSKEDRRFRYRTASLCRDRSRDIARLNDEIVALDAIIKVPWMQSWVYIAGLYEYRDGFCDVELCLPPKSHLAIVLLSLLLCKISCT